MLRRKIGLAVVLIALASTILLAMRQGLMPAALNLLPVIDLKAGPGLLLDWQLAALRRSRDLCNATLKRPVAEATAIDDFSGPSGCGLVNGIRLSSAGGARLPADKLTCEMAAAMALWIEHDVQPKARELFGQSVTSVQHMGTYDCRNIVGSPAFKNFRSQHASGNAIDISGFTLGDGRKITVKRGWPSKGAEAEFLHAIHSRSCRYFRVAIGPDYNAAHHDHFHFDRGWGSACR